MKRTILALAALLFAVPAQAERQPMEHCFSMVPYGYLEASSAATLLCRRGYLVGYDTIRRSPLWVSERLSAQSAWGCGERFSYFLVDPDLTRSQRASTGDYTNSGYDMGHLANSANHLSDPLAQRETAYLSNIVPKIHELNAGLWFRLEVMVRVWAAQRGDLVVHSGPAFRPGERTIGANRLPVPFAFWKVVVDPASAEMMAFLVPHLPLGWREDPGQFMVPIELLEEVAGVSIPRPPGWAIRMPPTQPWPVDVTLADNYRAHFCPR